MHKRQTVLMTGALLLGLGGCAVVAIPPVPYIATRVIMTPPAPRIEVISAAPAPGWYWVGGHWRWEGNRYEWMVGHWAEPRPNEVFVQARWVQQGAAWVFQPGQWVKLVRPADYVVVQAPKPPPPVRIEVVSAPPGIDYFWISGHWRWERGEHAWVGGHWEAHREGLHWIPAHWVQNG